MFFFLISEDHKYDIRLFLKATQQMRTEVDKISRLLTLNVHTAEQARERSYLNFYTFFFNLFTNFFRL